VLIKATTSERCRRLAFNRGLFQMSKIMRTRKKELLLQVFLVELEKDLHSGTEAGRLDFPPKSALVASHTVHNPTNVSEVLFELLF
jgi:hypothetical protein